MVSSNRERNPVVPGMVIDMTTAETLKKVKAINERLAVYERKGLTDSYVYRSIVNSLTLLQIPTTLSKTGTVRISRSKEALQILSNQVPQPGRKAGQGDPMEALLSVYAKGGLAQEKKLLKAEGIAEKDIPEIIALRGKLQQWIDTNMDDVYSLREKMEEAAKVYEMVKDIGLRKYTYTEIDDAIKKYETARDAMRGVAAKSKYARSYKNPYES